MLEELRKMGATDAVISSNLALRNDGLPRSGQRQPQDPAVAVYFNLDGESMVMGRDAFDRVEENIRSLTLAIQGLRQVDRHGGGTMFKRAFSGFTALPPPDQMSAIATPAPSNWFDVLGVAPDCALSVAEAAWKALSRGTPENERYDINAAIETAKKVLKR